MGFMTIPLDRIGAMTRTLESTERDGVPARVLVAARSYPAPLQDVWAALTEADRIARWFLPVSGDLRLGGRYRLEGNAGGTVETCDPPHAFSVTWEYDGDVSWVAVTLTPEGDGTALELRHTAPVTPQRWAEFGPGAVGVGWELGLLGLAWHLESGAPLDPSETAAWAASEEGVAFITGSSDAWCMAAVAAGDEPGAARAAADRTIAAYTGRPLPEDA
jgi:uncharacterized protein YndB with AHSA1/START domain